jgi:hypothetical protein
VATLTQSPDRFAITASTWSKPRQCWPMTKIVVPRSTRRSRTDLGRWFRYDLHDHVTQNGAENGTAAICEVLAYAKPGTSTY